MKHVISSQQFDRADLDHLFVEADDLTNRLKPGPALAKLHDRLAGKLMCTLFYEPSTRTRLSFESAALHFGMGVISTENASEFSSAAKGETLEDTIRVVGGYGFDIIVIRHRDTGAAERAARVCDEFGLDTHVINAGDGTGQHPTQALLDMYTIWRERADRQIDGLTVVIGGDLKHGRTVRSLAYLLSRYRTKIVFLSPPELAIGEDIKLHLREHDIEFREETVLANAFPEADVVYWTRVQRERIPDEAVRNRDFSDFVIGPDQMRLMKSDARLMHPLPRIHEISKAVDADPRAAYFCQAKNGLYIRMALLLRLTNSMYIPFNRS